MADITLNKMDTTPPAKPRQIQIADILMESRNNHNDLVDALLSINAVVRENSEALKELKDKFKSHPNSELAASIEFNAQSIKQLEDTASPAVRSLIDTNVKKVEADLLVKLSDHDDKMVNQEHHSRRLNTIVNNKEEKEDEKIEEVVDDFLINDLHLDREVVNGFLFRDMHRLPKVKNRDGTDRDVARPLIIAFVRQKDRNTVMRHAYELKETDISIKSDLPRALNNLRSKMLDVRRKLKTENPGIRYRVAEVGYKPVLQRADGLIPGTTKTKWVKIEVQNNDNRD